MKTTMTVGKLAGLSVLSLLAASGVARADGFLCGTDDRELNITVYHDTQSDEGTRNMAVMILSDPDAPKSQQTLARFDESNAQLSTQGTNYDAQIENTESREAEVYVSSLPLSNIRSVDLNVAFSYSDPAPSNQTMPGVLTIEATTGTITKDVSCVRYLKTK
jgi:hypothetical protein